MCKVTLSVLDLALSTVSLTILSCLCICTAKKDQRHIHSLEGGIRTVVWSTPGVFSFYRRLPVASWE